MPLLRFLFRPATAFGVAMAVFAALLVARTARDLAARFTDAGVPVLEVEYERVFRGAAGRRPRLVETGTHFIADDGRYRRDATALAAPGGAVRRRTSEIWLPPEGAGLDAGAPMEIGVAPDRAPVERIAIDHDTGRAVCGPLEFAWQSPSEYAALLRGDAPAPTSPEPEQAGLPRPEPVYVDSPAESLGMEDHRSDARARDTAVVADAGRGRPDHDRVLGGRPARDTAPAADRGRALRQGLFRKRLLHAREVGHRDRRSVRLLRRACRLRRARPVPEPTSRREVSTRRRRSAPVGRLTECARAARGA